MTSYTQPNFDQYDQKSVFQTYMFLELAQIFTNDKQRFYPFMEFYVIHLKHQGVKI